MTREEALTHLKLHDYWTHFSWQDEVCEIAIWAIKSIESIMAEKDAAVKILKKEVKDNFNLCYYCKHHSFDFCNDCDYEGSRWEWRGIQNETN